MEGQLLPNLVVACVDHLTTGECLVPIGLIERLCLISDSFLLQFASCLSQPKVGFAVW